MINRIIPTIGITVGLLCVLFSSDVHGQLIGIGVILLNGFFLNDYNANQE